jgi:putative ABC transport system ATP-binding protein
MTAAPPPAVSAAGKVAPAPAIVEMADISFAWPGAQKFVLSIKSLSLPANSRTLLLGPSGSGKSTLLSLLCGIIRPDRGSIRILGNDIVGLTSAARDRFRAEHIGVVFQMFNLLPYGSVIDNVILPLSFAPARRRRVGGTQGADREARRILHELGIDGDLLEGKAATLSVGQQQRVAVARALIGAPELIVADEPTSALDKARQDRFLELVFRQLDDAGASLIMVSHDAGLADRFDTVLQLQDIIRSEPA